MNLNNQASVNTTVMASDVVGDINPMIEQIASVDKYKPLDN